MALEGRKHNFACPCLFFFYYLNIDGIRLDCPGLLILQSPSGVVDHVEKDQFSSVAQSCPPLCNPMDWSLPGASAHGIFQARVLEWVAGEGDDRG